ncbi:Leucine-rich repeat family protein [Zea mays]|nr:Leucine-rich repeat family protein [Zea mays]
MGSACSRKRGQLVQEDDLYSARFSKSGSFKWLLHTLPRSNFADVQRRAQGPAPNRCPSLVELCVAKVCKDINMYSDLSLLPRDLSQQIFNELVECGCLTEASLGAFRDCDLQDLTWDISSQDICLGDYPGVTDAWMEVVASQGQSLLSVDLSCSDVTDSGFNLLKDCSSMQSLACDYCDQISEHGLKTLSGQCYADSTTAEFAVSCFSNLTSLSIKKCAAVTAEGAKAFANLVNLVNLDLERCPKINGGLIHLKGLKKLEKLNLRYCNGITDSDMKYLSDLTNLRELQLSSCKISAFGVSYLRGLHKLGHLNLEGCAVTAVCLELQAKHLGAPNFTKTQICAIAELASLVLLNLSRCGICDEGCENLKGLTKLKALSLGFNQITDACLIHLKDLVNLECLNLDSCKIGDEGLFHLKGLIQLKNLELSDTEVGSNGLRHLSG